MTQPIYRYNASTSCLEEQATMDRPIREDNSIDAGTEFRLRMIHYNQHISGLHSYPADFKDWPTGDLIEGRDFELKKKVLNQAEIKVTKALFKDDCGQAFIIIAVPLSSSLCDKLERTIHGRDVLLNITFRLADYFKTHPEKIKTELVSELIEIIRKSDLSSYQPKEESPNLFPKRVDFIAGANYILQHPELLREQMEGFATWISDNQVSILNHDEWLALKINKKINRFSELFDLYIEYLNTK